MAEGNRHYLDC